MATPVKLYWNKICPFVQRAWIAALEKNVALELVYVPLGGETPEWYKAINPRETVPTLQFGSKLIFESNLIVQFLDEEFAPKSSLQPGDALTKYRVRYFLEQVGEFVGYGYDLLRNGTDAAKREAFEGAVKTIEGLLAKQTPAGPFFLGSTFSVADIALFPFVDRFRATLGAYANFDLLGFAPRIAALHAAALLRPSVFSTSQSPAFYVTSYSSYGGKPAPEPALTLYSAVNCPFCERVRIAAAVKKVKLTIVEIDLSNVPASYLAINPAGSVPTLVTAAGDILPESGLIVKFLEESFPGVGATLLPSDASANYDGNFFAEAIGEFSGAMYKFVQTKGEAEAKKALNEAATVLEGLLAKQSAAGPFFFGAEISYFDIALLPFLLRIDGAEAIGAEYKFLHEYPRLSGIVTGTRANADATLAVGDRESYAAQLRKYNAAH